MCEQCAGRLNSNKKLKLTAEQVVNHVVNHVAENGDKTSPRPQR
jgi:hypothetical protein